MSYSLRAIIGRALLAALLFTWPLYAIGPHVLAPLLPLHERIVSHLDGGNFAQLRVFDNAAQTVHLRSTATLEGSRCGVRVLMGDAWVVRTSALHFTQQWLIALVVLVSWPTRSGWARAVWSAIALPLVFVQQFVTLPVLLAAGVEAVVCGKRVMLEPAPTLPPTPLLAVDAVLQNGGLWLITAVLLATTWLLTNATMTGGRCATSHVARRLIP